MPLQPDVSECHSPMAVEIDGGRFIVIEEERRNATPALPPGVTFVRGVYARNRLLAAVGMSQMDGKTTSVLLVDAGVVLRDGDTNRPASIDGLFVVPTPDCVVVTATVDGGYERVMTFWRTGLSADEVIALKSAVLDEDNRAGFSKVARSPNNSCPGADMFTTGFTCARNSAAIPGV